MKVLTALLLVKGLLQNAEQHKTFAESSVALQKYKLLCNILQSSGAVTINRS